MRNQKVAAIDFELTFEEAAKNKMQNLSIDVEFEPERVFFIPPWNRNLTMKEMIANFRADHPENMVLAEERLRPWLMTMSVILLLFFSFISGSNILKSNLAHTLI